MKYRIKTWQLLLLLLLTITIPMVTVITLAQDRDSRFASKNAESFCKGNHPSRKDFYKNARMLPPSTILEIVGNRVNYSTVDQGIDLGSLDLEDNYSIVPKNFSATKHDGCYGIVYCQAHLVILHIDTLEQKQCGVLKQ